MTWRNSGASCASLIAAFGLIAAIGCGDGGEGGENDNASAPADNQQNASSGNDTAPRLTPAVNTGENSPFEKSPKDIPLENPKVLFRTSHGDISVELFADKAPVTVDNFLENYVKRGFYNDTVFHYVEPGSMIVGGGYDSEYQLKETRAEIHCEADNGLSNKRGTLAMARAPDFAHSATSQFFFNLGDNTQFDHQSVESAETYGYCVFGKVTGGMAILEKIAGVETKESEVSPRLPAEPVVIRTIEIVD